MKKNHKIYLVLILLLHASCNGDAQSIKVTEIFTDLCVENTSIAINKDTIILLEYKAPKEISKSRSEWSVKNFIKKSDTFSLKEYRPINEIESDQLSTRMRAANYFIPNFTNAVFSYQPLPDHLKSQYENAEIIKLLNSNGYWYYLTRNKKSAQMNFNISSENNFELVKFPLPDNLNDPDFVLIEELNSTFPSVFIFTDTYFMNNNLVEIKGFRFKDTLERKRGF